MVAPECEQFRELIELDKFHFENIIRGAARLTRVATDAAKSGMRHGGDCVILEHATLNVKHGHERAFEAAFDKATAIIASMSGYAGLELQRCLEEPNRYLLLVRWHSLEDHIVGFRGSPQYQEWKKLLHHFYEPFPIVEHYELVFDA